MAIGPAGVKGGLNLGSDIRRADIGGLKIKMKIELPSYG